MDEFRQDFILEVEELLSEAESCLLQLEKTETQTEDLNLLFRIFHSVKGAAGMFGEDDLKEYVHHLENDIDYLLKNDVPQELDTSKFLTGIDQSRKLLHGEKVETLGQDQKIAELGVEEKSEDFTKKVEVKTQNHEAIEGALIYVVDDEEDLLEILTDLLESEGALVKGFTDARECLKAFNLERPEVILSDYKLPAMSGVDFLTEIRAKDHLIPFIMVSGFLTKDICMEVLNLGAHGVVEKPFATTSILVQVDRCIRFTALHKSLDQSLDLLVDHYQGFCEYLKKEDLENYDGFRARLKDLLRYKKEKVNKKAS